MKRLLLNLLLTAGLTGAALATSAPALAAAPQPVKAVAPNLFSGRWYEIARTPNMMQKDCQGSTSEFSGWSGGEFHVLQTCHEGAPQGPAKTYSAKARIIPASGNAKMKMMFFGGLVSQEYWILDHADDDAWAIMGTPGGKYVWLMSRRPVLDPATKAAALSRVHALGYDLSRLAFPQQLSR